MACHSALPPRDSGSKFRLTTTGRSAEWRGRPQTSQRTTATERLATLARSSPDPLAVHCLANALATRRSNPRNLKQAMRAQAWLPPLVSIPANIGTVADGLARASTSQLLLQDEIAMQIGAVPRDGPRQRPRSRMTRLVSIRPTVSPRLRRINE